ncbi:MULTISPECIES: hypothetical protein [unclassified Pseudoalteromonas]|uniref:hypothetical protein n=1 Tax=unclassified Pseudoalteromonas TaxID=194690 RepID=UPI0025B35F77|nr:MULTISPECIES: hypothetical protein [unclassified Pseudoalteromonas]MDN3379734.1 hypothetical protein [Pseudoalteromonas sp. APC 3893]MDN3388140.1 hypothetical protein [Pseudoalteromonas sp. APC 4017]
MKHEPEGWVVLTYQSIDEKPCYVIFVHGEVGMPGDSALPQPCYLSYHCAGIIGCGHK